MLPVETRIPVLDGALRNFTDSGSALVRSPNEMALLISADDLSCPSTRAR